MPPRVRARVLWRAALAACLLPGVAAGQLPGIAESIEVRVVEVDVVVTDADGTVVRGLEASDFELRVDGRPVEIDYFDAVVERRPGGGPRDSAAAPASAGGRVAATRPFVVIVYDGRRLQPARAREAIAELRARLGDIVVASDGVMVARLGMGLVIEQPLTSDLGLLDAAVARLVERKLPALEVGGRELILRRLEGDMPPRLTLAETADEEIVEHARRLLQEIRAQAEVERFEMEAASTQLLSLVRSLAGLPGRKAVLFLGDGLRAVPAEPLFQLWWDRFGRWGPALGVVSIDTVLSPLRSDRRLLRLVEAANAHRVSFFTHDPAGLRAIGGGARYSTISATQHVARELEQQLDALAALARSTGGVGRIDAGGLEPLLGEMLAGFGSYYSLGFDPGERRAGRVEVRVRAPELKVRYLDRFAVRSAREQLEEATAAALFIERPSNELDVGVELGRGERQRDGTWVVPMLVKVPIARLSLLPRDLHHVGRLSVVVIAQSGGGQLSEPAHGEVPIEIDNRELAGAMGRLAAYRMRLRVAAGEQRIAIGVRDDVARREATLSLLLDPERDV